MNKKFNMIYYVPVGMYNNVQTGWNIVVTKL